MLTERQLLILKAIIRDYTNEGQPIGSKRLDNRLFMQVRQRFEMRRLRLKNWA